ncbi:MAG: DUF3098 domain-containing protein [Saprospiraceae bacterium]|nr:DUF3098 domain-containing protein [Saprospiraceae bacterium]
MSKSKPGPKRVVVPAAPTAKKTAAATPRTRQSVAVKQELMFGRQNYILFIAGAVLIFIGLALMVGGHMPSPDVWDESLIYSFRRITLAPILIVAGLVVEIFAIFKK